MLVYQRVWVHLPESGKWPFSQQISQLSLHQSAHSRNRIHQGRDILEVSAPDPNNSGNCRGRVAGMVFLNWHWGMSGFSTKICCNGSKVIDFSWCFDVFCPTKLEGHQQQSEFHRNNTRIWNRVRWSLQFASGPQAAPCRKYTGHVLNCQMSV